MYTYRPKKGKKKRRPSPTAKGHTFEQEIKRSLEQFEQGVTGMMWWDRIYDTKDYVSKTCPYCHTPIRSCSSCGRRFPRLGMKTPKRMADFHLLLDGTYILLECKATGVKNGFMLNMVKPHQHSSMVTNHLAGGRSVILVKSTHSKMKPMFAVDIMEYEKLRENRKFVPWKELGKKSLEVTLRTPNSGKPYYDLGWLKDLVGPSKID